MKTLTKFLILAVFLSMSVYAQKSAKEQLADIQNKYKSAKDFSVEFNQSLNNQSGTSGRMMYSKGNKLRVELKNMTIISDGKTVWNYNNSKNQVIVNNADNGSESFFTIDNFLNDYPSKCTVTSEDDNGKQVLVLTPNKNSGISFKKAKIWIGNDNVIERIIVENSKGTMNVNFSGYSFNKNIPDSRFSFSAPEGTKVIDLRK